MWFLLSESFFSRAYLDEVLSSYRILRKIDESTFVHGRGHRKTSEQRNVEKLIEYRDKLSEYVEKLKICGEDRNSYSKTDHTAIKPIISPTAI